MLQKADVICPAGEVQGDKTTRVNIKRQTNTDRYFGFQMQIEKSMKNFSISNILGAIQNMDLREQDVLVVRMAEILTKN